MLRSFHSYSMAESESAREMFSVAPFRIMTVYADPSNTDTVNTPPDDQPGPLARSGHRMVCVGRKLYVFGGYNPKLQYERDSYFQLTKPLFAELWEFNTLANRWRKQYQGHMGRSHGLVSFGCVVSGHSMFHVGGTGWPFGECSNNWLYLCDLHTGNWEKLETEGQKPREAYGQGVVLSGNDMFVVGGTTGYEYNLDVHHINIVDRVWSSLSKTTPSTPMPRYRHEVLMHEGELLLIGGGQKDTTSSLEILSSFNIASGCWRAIPTKPDPEDNTFPEPRKCHVVVQHKNCVYIHGGCNETKSLGDMWCLDLSVWQWSRRPSCNNTRFFHTAAVTEEGCMYMHGGVDPDGNRSADLLKVWLTVPPLRRLCWDALQHYSPRLLDRSPLSLYQLGLPSLDIRDAELMPDPATITPPPVFSPPPPDSETDEEEEEEPEFDNEGDYLFNDMY